VLGADIRGPFFYFYSCVREAATGLEAFGDREVPEHIVGRVLIRDQKLSFSDNWPIRGACAWVIWPKELCCERFETPPHKPMLLGATTCA
jgi:hypothetical protein